MRAHRPMAPAGSRPAAHESFRQRTRQWSWIGLALAALLHFAMFTLAPPFQVTYWRTDDPASPHSEMRAMQLLGGVRLLGAVKIPDGRDASSRYAPILEPAVPIVAPISPLGEIKFAPVTMDFGPVLTPVEIPAPPTMPDEAKSEFANFVHFMPSMIKPELLNREEVRRRLRREYPMSLQSAGIGGSVLIVFWIDEQGTVRKWELRQSSGKKLLDRAAERVVPHMKFRPGIKLGEPINVIVALPIRFESY